jgi:stage IV sporulation protein FA
MIDNIKEEMKKRRNIVNIITKDKTSNKLLFSFFVKTLLLILIGLIVLIFIKDNDKNKEMIYDIAFKENISFSGIKTFYNKYIGGVLPFDNFIDVETPVFNENLKYKEINKYKDGIVLTVDDKYLVPTQVGGIITFIGEKEGYGNTVIIESENVTIWYGNINNVSVNLYDYIEKGMFLGETLNNKLYLVYEKEGSFLNYKDYLK